MNVFKSYHPIINFIYFTIVIGFSMFFMHPICLISAVLCGFVYSVLLNGKKYAKKSIGCIVPMMLTAALINPAFNHEGVTILTYLPSGNPLTLESIVYGLFAAVMLASVIYWFSCCSKVLTSDKFIYLFGRIIPSLSLIISMTLRFIPKFTAQFKAIANAQKCIGRDISNGSIIKRAKYALSVLSIMITWALENSLDTADSMKSRGYGIRGRTAYSIYTFDKRDAKLLICIVILGLYVFVGNLAGAIKFKYFPSMSGIRLSPYCISCFAAYLILCSIPIILEFLEARKWKFLKQKI